jgi:hypothetical protein
MEIHSHSHSQHFSHQTHIFISFSIYRQWCWVVKWKRMIFTNSHDFQFILSAWISKSHLSYIWWCYGNKKGDHVCMKLHLKINLMNFFYFNKHSTERRDLCAFITFIVSNYQNGIIFHQQKYNKKTTKTIKEFKTSLSYIWERNT